jgi:hypothetical protein
MLLTPGRQCAIRSADLLTFFFPPSGWCRYSKIKGAEVEGEIVFKLGTLFMLQEVEEGIDREALAAGNNHVHVFKVQHGMYSLVLEANCREDMEEWVSGREDMEEWVSGREDMEEWVSGREDMEEWVSAGRTWRNG